MGMVPLLAMRNEITRLFVTDKVAAGRYNLGDSEVECRGLGIDKEEHIDVVSILVGRDATIVESCSGVGEVGIGAHGDAHAHVAEGGVGGNGDLVGVDGVVVERITIDNSLVVGEEAITVEIDEDPNFETLGLSGGIEGRYLNDDRIGEATVDMNHGIVGIGEGGQVGETATKLRAFEVEFIKGYARDVECGAARF